MSGKKVKLWYDREGDIIEVFWDNAEGYFTATENDRVMANVDLAGNVQGFLIEGVSNVTGSPLEVNLMPETPDAPVDRPSTPSKRKSRLKPGKTGSQEG